MKAIFATCALLGGCALVQPPPKPAPAPPSPRELVSFLTIGESTKAEVRAALGQGEVVDFTSGYEVWVYRERRDQNSPAPAAEVVLLFAPSGILSKTRVR